MTDKIEAAIARGRHAENLLADELLTTGFDELRASYLKAWEATKYNDTDGRERLWQAYQIVGKVRSHLEQVMSSGSVAKSDLDGLAGQRPKLFGIV